MSNTDTTRTADANASRRDHRETARKLSRIESSLHNLFPKIHRLTWRIEENNEYIRIHLIQDKPDMPLIKELQGDVKRDEKERASLTAEQVSHTQEAKTLRVLRVQQEWAIVDSE